MTIHEFGKDRPKIIVLIHPSIVRWDYFEFVIPLLENSARIIVPALPGYDESDRGDFTSVEDISEALARWLRGNGINSIDVLYGCSMGGSIVMRMLANGEITVGNAVVDGGIAPYRLPWIVTRLIAIRDFLMILIGKWAGVKLLSRFFTSDEYSESDLEYAAGVLKSLSYRTIWRTFESCNNYKMPAEPLRIPTRIQYWCAASEEKDRRDDIEYVREMFPDAVFKVFPDVGHGGMALLRPEKFARFIEELL